MPDFEPVTTGTKVVFHPLSYWHTLASITSKPCKCTQKINVKGKYIVQWKTSLEQCMKLALTIANECWGLQLAKVFTNAHKHKRCHCDNSSIFWNIIYINRVNLLPAGWEASAFKYKLQEFLALKHYEHHPQTYALFCCHLLQTVADSKRAPSTALSAHVQDTLPPLLCK